VSLAPPSPGSTVAPNNIHEDPNGCVNHQPGQVDVPFPVGEFEVVSDTGHTPWRGSTDSHDTQEQARALTNWFGRAIAHPTRWWARTSSRSANRRVAYGLYSRRAGGANADAAVAKGTR